ncbi:MAG: glycosyltransferase family 2 protein [Planctomycetota bacterium]
MAGEVAPIPAAGTYRGGNGNSHSGGNGNGNGNGGNGNGGNGNGHGGVAIAVLNEVGERQPAHRAAVHDPAAGRAVLHELTIFIITHNERRFLPRCLDSCRFAGHVVVLDSGSDDGTVDYARKRGAEVATHTHWDGFGAQKNRALEMCRTEWVMNIDADEWISPDLADEITAIIHSGSAMPAYDVSRRCRFDGRIIRCCNWWPHRVTRLFRREQGRFNDRLVHESVIVDGDGEVGSLREELDHEPYRDLLHLIQKNIMYARAGAEQMVRDGRRVSTLAMLTMGPLRWCRDMFVKGGWRAGATGMVIAGVQAFSVFARYGMVWLDRRRIRRGEDSRLAPTHEPPARALGKLVAD